MAVRKWLICSNRKLYHKNRSFCYRDTTQQHFFSYTLWPSSLHKSSIHICIEKDMSTLSRRSKRTPFRNNVLNEISRKSNLNRITWLKFCDRNCTIRGAARNFVWEGSLTDIVRFQTLAILHKDHFDVTGQFLVYYNRIWRQRASTSRHR